MVTNAKRTIVVAVIVSLIMTAPVAFGVAGLDLGGTSVAQAAAKKGFVKKSGKWYYYKSGKKVKGLKKISGKYYYFNKKGVMESGQKKIKGAIYYFNKVKSGKKKGQAPALANKSKKMSGKIYYFQKNGKRYKFGYKSTGKQKGNDAVGAILSGAKVTTADENGLKKAYKYLVKKYSYVSKVKISEQNHSKKNWEYAAAKTFISEKGGKCYQWAAITALTAKALGYEPKLIVGKWQRSAGGTWTEHAWVIINEGDDNYLLDSLKDNLTSKGLTYFFRSVGSQGDTEYSCEGIQYRQTNVY